MGENLTEGSPLASAGGH